MYVIQGSQKKKPLSLLYIESTSPNIKIYGHCEVLPVAQLSDFVTPWIVVYQASPFMEFSRQEYWSGLPFPSPGDHPDPGIEPGSPTLQADALPSKPPGKFILPAE